MMDYSVVIYTTVLAPSYVIFQGLCSESGMTAVVSMLALGDAELKYQMLDMIKKKDELYLSPSDNVPYYVSIRKII